MGKRGIGSENIKWEWENEENELCERKMSE
jgi:hypothetical protein